MFREAVAHAWRQLGIEGTVAVAASGGIDSTVLLRTLHAVDVPLVALHVDHGLRDDAGEDAAFVEALADELSVPFERLHVELATGNVQGEARRSRYGALARAAGRHGCAAVATGHTATDQAETVLMHLVRGTGLRGLAGMPVRRPLTRRVELVRPLLGISRHDVEAEAAARAWRWREDASNATDAYQRNRIRHDVLPLLEQEGGRETVHRIAAAARAARASLPDLGRFAVPGERALAVDAVLALQDRSALWAEALAAWAPDARRSRDLIRQLDGLATGQVGRHVPVGDLAAWRDRDAVRFAAPAAPVDVSVELGQLVQTPLGTLELAETDAARLHETTPSNPEGSDASDSVLLDASLVGQAMRLRTWRAGDRIAPHGLDGTKRVSDVLTERRVPPSARDRQLVLCAGGRLAWVVGHRLAAWAGVSEASARAVRATWTPVVSLRR